MNDLRLIIDPPRDGSMNMAIDEALLESAATIGIGTLRLYQWSEPTLSLGYFQAAAEREMHLASLNCPIVRRASGGGAILHDRELTYSIALPEMSSSAAASRHLYEQIHASIIALLDDWGIVASLYRAAAVCEKAQHDSAPQPFLCFQRRSCFDIVSGEAKIVGSAQRRRRGAILQHGSILLSRSECAPELPGIEQIVGKTVTTAQIADVWPPRLAGYLGCYLRRGSLTETEISLSETLCRERFAADDWVRRR